MFYSCGVEYSFFFYRSSQTNTIGIMSHLRSFKSSTRDPDEVFRRLKKDSENNVSDIRKFQIIPPRSGSKIIK